jgi:hypothetical protein
MSSGCHDDINIEELEGDMVMYDDAIDMLMKVALQQEQYPDAPAPKAMQASQARGNKCQLPHSTAAANNHLFKRLCLNSPHPIIFGGQDCTLIWSGDGLMLIVDGEDPKCNCAPHHIKGAIFPLGTRYSFSHENGMKKWPSTTLELWAKLVKETDQIA